MGLSRNWEEFYTLSERLRHRDGAVEFENRNFCTLSEWVPHNDWLLQDITEYLTVRGAPVVQYFTFNVRDAVFEYHQLPGSRFTCTLPIRLRSRQMFYRLVLTCAVAVGTIVIPGSGAPAQQPGNTVSVDGSRPLARFVERIQHIHGIPISYEDPPYEYSSDLEDVTLLVRRDLDRFPPGHAPKVLIPRRGSLSVQYELLPGTSEIENAARAVSEAARLHSTAGYAEFTIVQMDQRISVIPAMAKSASGVKREIVPVLDTHITLHADIRTPVETLQLLMKEVEQRRGVRIIGGAAPKTFLQESAIMFGSADSDPARTVLGRLLDTVDPEASWHLYHSPSLNLYVLNLLPAAERKAADTSDPSVKFQNVPVPILPSLPE